MLEIQFYRKIRRRQSIDWEWNELPLKSIEKAHKNTFTSYERRRASVLPDRKATRRNFHAAEENKP